MPRFHFHLMDGRDSPDPEGTELATTENARREALRFAGEMLAMISPNDPFAKRWEMQVTDDEGLTLFCLDFALTESPAVAQTGASR